MSQLNRRTLTEAERLLKEQCEETIRAGLTSFMEVGQALTTMRDGKLYRELYATFEDYCASEYGISRTRGYELMNAAAVVSAIADTGMQQPTNEAQARALSRLPEEQRAEVWKKTLDQTEGKPTAAAVNTAAGREKASPGPASPGDEDGAATPSDAQPQPVAELLAGAESDETGVQGEAPRQPSTSVDGRRPGDSGVSPLAAAPERSGGNEERGRAAAPVPVSGGLEQLEKLLDEHVPDTDPHRKWRNAWLRSVKNAWGPASFAVADIVANGDDSTFAVLIDVRDFFDDLLTKVQAERIRVAAAEHADLPDNVTPIRRTA